VLVRFAYSSERGVNVKVCRVDKPEWLHGSAVQTLLVSIAGWSSAGSTPASE